MVGRIWTSASSSSATKAAKVSAGRNGGKISYKLRPTAKAGKGGGVSSSQQSNSRQTPRECSRGAGASPLRLGVIGLGPT